MCVLFKFPKTNYFLSPNSIQNVKNERPIRSWNPAIHQPKVPLTFHFGVSRVLAPLNIYIVFFPYRHRSGSTDDFIWQMGNPWPYLRNCTAASNFPKREIASSMIYTLSSTEIASLACFLPQKSLFSEILLALASPLYLGGVLSLFFFLRRLILSSIGHGFFEIHWMSASMARLLAVGYSGELFGELPWL